MTNYSKLNIGIVGLGNFGKKRYELLTKHSQIGRIITADKYGEANIYGDNCLDELLEYNLDAIFICVPHIYTSEYTIKALNKNMNVFAEKPPAINYDEMLKVKKVYDKSDAILKYGFNHRYSPSVIFAKKLIEENNLGKLIWMKGTYGKCYFENWRSNKNLAKKGILLGQGIHILDLFLHFSNSKLKKTQSLSYNYFTPDKEIEDNIFVLIEYDNGVQASLHSSACMWMNTFRILLEFEDAYIKLNGHISGSMSYGYPETVTIGYKNDMEFYGNPTEKTYYFGEDNSLKYEVDEFVDCILNKNKIVNGSIDDALEIMKQVDDIYRNRL